MFDITRKRFIVWLMPIMVSMFVTGCGTEGDSILGDSFKTSLTPRVVATAPEDKTTNVFYNTKYITAEFNVPMDVTTLTSSSFTLFDVNSSAPVTGGTVTYANRVAELALDANLSINTVYTATITTDAENEDGIALLSDYVWEFTTGSTADTTAPYVNSTSPKDGISDVLLSKIITATFSEAMRSSSITDAGTFSVKKTIADENITGFISYSTISKTASFKPDSYLAADTNYTATITKAATDLAGKAMADDYSWTFETGSTLVQQELVDFGSASTYGIASSAGVTNTHTVDDKTWIDGNVVLNPTPTCNSVQTTSGEDGTFGLCDGMAPELTFGHEVITQIYPDTTTADAVRADLHQAYLDITPANMSSGIEISAPTTLGSGSTGQNTFTTGVYKSGTSILITGDLTLDAEGNPNATFVFQSASTIGTEPNARILLVGGAKASNVYWQVGSSATLGGGTIWNGNTLAAASITMENGTESCGRLFAGATIDSGAFTFQSNLVSVPGNSALLVGCE